MLTVAAAAASGCRYNGDCGCGWQLNRRREWCRSTSSREIFDNRTTYPRDNDLCEGQYGNISKRKIHKRLRFITTACVSYKNGPFPLFCLNGCNYNATVFSEEPFPLCLIPHVKDNGHFCYLFNPPYYGVLISCSHVKSTPVISGMTLEKMFRPICEFLQLLHRTCTFFSLKRPPPQGVYMCPGLVALWYRPPPCAGEQRSHHAP